MIISPLMRALEYDGYIGYYLYVYIYIDPKICILLHRKRNLIISSSDSDYQLGSAVQTPGLNNSTAPAEYETPSQHITPLTEAYIARDRPYAPQNVS